MKQQAMYTIKQAAQYVGKSAEYVRRAIHQGKILTTKVEIANNTFRHEIAHEELMKWRASAEGGGSRREDGRNKFTIYGTPSEMLALQALLKENGITLPLKRANKVKKS
jgi:excisionase family DNA binding protein